MYGKMISLFVFLAVFAIMASPAFASTTVGYCQSFTTPDTIYVLNQSITDASGTCFVANATNITLDCAGFTIDGVGTGYGVDIDNAPNFTLTNCDITEFASRCVFIRDSSDYSVVQNVNVSYCENGIEVDNSDYVNITDSSAYYSSPGSPAGIRLGGTNYAYVSNVTLVGSNGASGFGDGLELFNANNSTLTGVVTDDNYYGMDITASAYTTLTDSDISNNRHGGITVSSSNYLVITDTKITNNTAQDGLHINGVHNGYFYNITSYDNGDDGIHASIDNDNNVFQDINASSNTGYGLYFDGSGNTGNTVDDSSFCGNSNGDIRDGDSNTGDENSCNTTSNWNDNGTIGCTYFCGEVIPTIISSCQTISSGGKYKLNQSIIDHSGDCFITTADNIIIDCDGYTIDGQGTDEGITFESNNVTIQNCIITEFSYGIRSNHNDGFGYEIRDSEISYNADVGIFIPLDINDTIFENLNISYNGDYGLSASSCDNCNVTDIIFLDNDDNAISWQGSDNGNIQNIYIEGEGIRLSGGLDNYFYNITSVGSSSVIDITSSSHGNTFDLVSGTGCTVDKCVGISTGCDNNTLSNIHVSNGTKYGLSVSGTGNSVSDSTFTNFAQSDFKARSDLCSSSTNTYSNVTMTGGYPFVYHMDESPYALSDTTFSLAFICYSSSVTLDNVTQIGNINNGLYLINVKSATITDSSFTDYYEAIFTNVTLNMIDTSFSKQESSRSAFILSTGTSFNISGLTLSNTVGYGMSISGGTSGEIYDSSLFGNTSALRMSNSAGDASVDIYNSNIDRTQSDSGDGAIRLYCSYFDPGIGYYCNDTNTANLYNTTLKDYSVTNSTLNIYWYLSVTNSEAADITIWNSNNDTVSTFSDTSKQVTLLQSFTVPVDNETTHTPHWLNATKPDCDTFTPVSQDMDQNRDYAIVMSCPTPPSPITGSQIVLRSSLIILGIVLILGAIAFLLVRMETGVSIRELIMAVVVIMIILIAVGFVQLTITAI